MAKTTLGKIVVLFAAAAPAAARSFPLPTGSFSHDMPAETGEAPLSPSRSELEAVFRDPFGKVQTGVYWYWLSGNVSSDGVRRDLEAMKRAGIDRAYIGDIGAGGNKQGPVKTFSPEWEKALGAAFETASALGIEIGLFNSPGWSQSGGPWVTADQAMRRFVSSVAVVEGPANGVKLPRPKFDYAPPSDAREYAVVAYPVPDGFQSKIEVFDKSDSLKQKKGKPLAVELAAAGGPILAQSAQLDFSDGQIAGSLRVEARKDGKWKNVCNMDFSRIRHDANGGFEPHAPVVAAFAPVAAEKFRVTVTPKDKKYESRFARIAICGAPLVSKAAEKHLGKMFERPLPLWGEYLWPDDPAEKPGSAFDPAKAVVLRGKVAPDGTLDWSVPPGTWAIYRFCTAPTGTKNGPANPEATGYEADKMSEKNIARHVDEYLGKIVSRIPPEHRKAVRHCVLDSYEQGGQNYTDDFAAKFKASFGYDPKPYLPVLAGMPAGSRDDSNRFLWDLRRFVADEVAYSYVGGLRRAAGGLGMKTWLECYGHWGFPGEFLQYGGQSDAIGGEFWSEGSLGDIENRAASSCGHIYGKRQIWSESNTCGGGAFERGPMNLKSRTDRFFADGINATILHLYTHQPDERAPGFIAWFGNEFNRHNSWFDHFDLFTGYLKRTGYMLQQGLNVADVAYFIGEDAPKMTGAATPGVPRGSQYDYINAEVLRETAGVDGKGRIVLPHGTSYEVLILPPLKTMRPELLEKIERMVEAGAFVMGPKPERSPSLAGQPAADRRVKEIADRLWGEVDGKRVKFAKRGRGTIAWGLSLDEVFAMRGIETDIAHDGRHHLIHAHRKTSDKDIYFVACFGGKPAPGAKVSFRVAGRIPEIWDPATGEIREAEEWTAKGNRTEVTFSLAPHGSVFVVFAKEANGMTGAKRGGTPSRTALAGPWTLSFESDPLHRGPAKPVETASLFDLSQSADPAIKHYSGKVVYKTKFSCPAKFSRAVLDLGNVAVTAKVKVNGEYAGGVCFAPWRLDVTRFAKAGVNELEVEVCNLWVNRLIGDAKLPNRPTWTSIPCCTKSKLKPSGLLGPVILEMVP